jgi:hypothetical protein
MVSSAAKELKWRNSNKRKEIQTGRKVYIVLYL